MLAGADGCQRRFVVHAAGRRNTDRTDIRVCHQFLNSSYGAWNFVLARERSSPL
jgi:hypothetical protein